MTEKNERSVIQKNSVLLDWAGFGYEGDKYWIYPDGTRHFHNWVGDQLPIDLYHSLDALDKWCFPKLHAIDLERMFLSWVWMEERPRPPLAHHCAEAILSLIGEE